ncbi:MAG: hypothetical protein Q9213_005975 [Squamulea squamosa]
MPSQPPIPPLLSTQLRSASEGSLSLVTSVLGASANWVILRQIYAVLKFPSGHQVEATVVVLGLNLSQNGGITFINALQSGLGLQEGGIGEVERSLLKVIEEAKTKHTKVLLVLDGIDFLLAATEITADDVLDSIWELKEHVYATIVSTSADYPLIQAQHSPLELNHAAFVMSLAHEANVIWGVRGLDTGSARDVSGVLRIIRGPAMGSMEDVSGEDVEEKELLYFVAGDGGYEYYLEKFNNIGDTSKLKKAILNHDEYANRHGNQGLFPTADPQKQQRVPRPSASAITNLTRCADAAVAVPSTSKNTPAHHAAIPQPKSVNVHNWGMKAKRRKTTGTGRMRTLKEIPRKFKNGFQTGAPKGSKGPGVNA